MLRAFFGGSRSPKSMELDDEELLATVRRELSDLLGIDGEPLFHRIYRWPRSNPQYDVGHLERVAEIERELPSGPVCDGQPVQGSRSARLRQAGAGDGEHRCVRWL